MDQRAAHGRGTELHQWTSTEPLQSADRPCFEPLESERAGRHKLLEPPNAHFIEPAFSESRRGLARPNRCRPAKEGALGEYQMRPWEAREQVPTQRVVPRRPEGRDDLPARRQVALHHSEHLRRVIEVLERLSPGSTASVLLLA